MSKIEVFITGINEEQIELVIAELSLASYDSFWQDEDGLRAYIYEEKFEEIILLYLEKKYFLGCSRFNIQKTEPGKWERVKEEFEPFEIASQVHICSENNKTDDGTFKYNLIVQADMAFGTGKHPSTKLCITKMLEYDFEGRSVTQVSEKISDLMLMSENQQIIALKK